jgi:hypothetical protein
VKVDGVRHRFSRRRFAIHGGDIMVELFWHAGYRTTGALVLHKPTGKWDVVFGRLGNKANRPIISKVRQLSIWLAHPEVQKVSKRLLGRKAFRKNEALMWVKEIDPNPHNMPGPDHT